MAFKYRIASKENPDETARYAYVENGFKFERNGGVAREVLNLANKRKFMHAVMPNGKGETFEKIFAMPTWEAFRLNGDFIAAMCKSFVEGAKIRSGERLVKLAETVKVLRAVSMSAAQIKAAQKVDGYSDLEIDAALVAAATAEDAGEDDSAE